MTVRPIHALLGFMLLCLTAAAAPFEGLTATYRDKESGALMVVEVAADGKARINGGDQGYTLIIGKQGYQVGPGPGGPVVVNYEVQAWLMAEDIRTGRMMVLSDGVTGESARPETANPPRLVAKGKRKIGRWKGTEIAMEGDRETRLVVSEDPALTAIGAPLGAYFSLIGSTDPTFADPADAVLEQYLADKGVLAFWGFELIKLEPGPIDPGRFAFPAKPIELADVQTPPVPGDDDQDSYSAKAAHFLGTKLLIQFRDGTISSWSEGSSTPEPFALPGKVESFCTHKGEAWLATLANEKDVTIWAGAPGAWRKVHDLTVGDEEQYGLIDCSGAQPLLLTSKGIRNLVSGAVIPTAIPKGMQGGEFTSMQHGDYLYVGSNAGEWGGSLVRFPLDGGAGKALSEKDPSTLCGGMRDMSCDPVTGLAPDPARPDCILVTTGLAHMISIRGSVLRVCDGQFSLAYAKPYTMEANWTFDPTAPLPRTRNTVKFDGLVHNARGTWAAASDGYYRFGSEPAPQFTKFPLRMDGFAGLVDWSHPDFVLVRTNKNQRHSISGASLIIVAR